MKKLLIITLSLSEKNGLGRYSRDLIRELSRKYELTIFSGKERDDFEADNCRIFRILPSGTSFFRLRNPFLSLFYALKIYKTSRRVDLIHSFMDYPHSFLASIVSVLIKKPLILTAHGTYSLEPFRMWPDKYFHGLALRRAKKIICISGFTEKELKNKINVSNTIIINDGINFDKFNNYKFIGEKKNDVQILGVGILKARKGYHISIPAIAEVKKRYRNIKYYIIGNHENKRYFDLLKSLVSNYSLEDNVVFVDNINDNQLIDFYYLSDIFLLTSVNINDNFEGFGLVYLEAGACGKPAIGTLGCGAEDAIVDGETGILVPQNDIQKTAEAILKLLDNPELAQKMGENGRKRAKEMDWDNVVKKYIEIYENNR